MAKEKKSPVNQETPFADEAFSKEVIDGVHAIEFKLYGKVDAKLIAHDPPEIDFNMGEMHMTEVDLKKLSSLMDIINKKYRTQITYCLYHSSNFPGKMLLNIRSPAAPMLLDANIKF